MANKRLRIIWRGMKNRCYNKTHISYKYYGERGIEICSQWLNDFYSFELWALSNGYSNELTLDRKNTNGNYEPSNCRWSTRKEQQNNRRDNIKNCDNLTPSQLSEKTGCSYMAAYLRISRKNKQYDKQSRPASQNRQ